MFGLRCDSLSFKTKDFAKHKIQPFDITPPHSLSLFGGGVGICQVHLHAHSVGSLSLSPWLAGVNRVLDNRNKQWVVRLAWRLVDMAWSGAFSVLLTARTTQQPQPYGKIGFVSYLKWTILQAKKPRYCQLVFFA